MGSGIYAPVPVSIRHVLRAGRADFHEGTAFPFTNLSYALPHRPKISFFAEGFLVSEDCLSRHDEFCDLCSQVTVLPAPGAMR